MRRKKIQKKKQHPWKYRQFKGCFGYYLPKKEKKRNAKPNSEKPDYVDINNQVCIYDENVFDDVTNAFNAIMENPGLGLNMRNVDFITINGGLLLKAFYEEYCYKYNKEPLIKWPKDKRARAVIKYLGIKNLQDVNVKNYPDIMCWQIYPLDEFIHKDVNIGKLLDTEIIPKCWKGDHEISEHSSTIASSVAEALHNCKEHAYTGEKENSGFKRWYLGVGEYPNSHKFYFCIYDKGIGIKARLKDNSSNWFDGIKDFNKTDSEMIDLATKGKRVPDGRGEGLKGAIELLKKNKGYLDIFSDKGYFSSYDSKSGKDRTSRLEGTMVSFSFPITYNKGSE